MMRSANPALTAATFRNLTATGRDVMTIPGTVAKTSLLLFLVVCSAAFTWHRFVQDPASAGPWMIGGLIGGLVLGLVTVFAKKAAPFTSPLYALCQGLAMGAVSAAAEAKYGGIVLQAAGLTFGTLAALLAAYRSGLIRATENFKLGLAAAMGGLLLFIVVQWVLGFFGVRIPHIHGNGVIGILFSTVLVGIAALNLVMDFDFIEQGAEQGAPKYMEWYAAFGLLVTLIWLYVEVLRLLSKARSRR